MPAYTVSLGLFSAIASIIVVVLATVGLQSAKTALSKTCIMASVTAFLIQRFFLVVEAEGVPDVDCNLVNGISYTCLVVMRVFITAGMYDRTMKLNRNSPLYVYIKYLSYFSVLLTVASDIMLIQMCVSSKLVFNCFQDLDATILLLNNWFMLVAICILTMCSSIPIFRLVTNDFLGSQGTRHMNMIRRMKVFTRMVEFVPIAIMLILLFLNLINKKSDFVLFLTLVFNDFCQISLLLFPAAILSSGDKNVNDLGATSRMSAPEKNNAAAAEKNNAAAEKNVNKRSAQVLPTN